MPAVAQAVRTLILDGRISLRTRVPAERDLAAALQMSRTTVTAAYDLLRQDGFLEAMARHGEPLVPTAEGNFTQASGEAAMQRLLLERPDLDGVFAANDLMAQGALHILREHGRRVPEDVRVVGFDDSSAAVASRPALTTVRQPVEEMGARAVAELLGRAEGQVVMETKLVLRESA